MLPKVLEVFNSAEMNDFYKFKRSFKDVVDL